MNDSAPPQETPKVNPEPIPGGKGPSASLDKRPDGSTHTPARWFRATSASSIGIEIAIAVCVPTLIGRWVDGKWPHIAPFGIIFGLIVGCGGAARAVQRALADYQRELKNPNRADESLFVPGSMGSLLHKAGQARDTKAEPSEPPEPS